MTHSASRRGTANWCAKATAKTRQNSPCRLTRPSVPYAIQKSRFIVSYRFNGLGKYNTPQLQYACQKSWWSSGFRSICFLLSSKAPLQKSWIATTSDMVRDPFLLVESEASLRSAPKGPGDLTGKRGPECAHAPVSRIVQSNFEHSAEAKRMPY